MTDFSVRPEGEQQVKGDSSSQSDEKKLMVRHFLAELEVQGKMFDDSSCHSPVNLSKTTFWGEQVEVMDDSLG